MSENKYPVNFNELEIKLNKEARSLAEKEYSELTEDEINFIKMHYNGRQAFKGFYTAASLAKFMYALLQPEAGTLLEPCCGAGRLLENMDFQKLDVTCFEIDKKSAILCKKMYPEIKIEIGDALVKKSMVEGRFDYFMANPPWGLKLSGYKDYELQNVDTQECSTALFLELCISSLKDNGMGVIGLPSSFFSEDFRLAHQYLDKKVTVLAKIDFPHNAYYSSNILVSGSIIILKKGVRKEENTCFKYIINNSEWNTLNDRDNELLLNKIVEKYKAFGNNND